MASSMSDFDLPPDVSAKQRALKRREAIMQSLMGQAMGPHPTQTAGGIAIRQGPFEGLARVAAAYMAGKDMKAIDKESAALSAQYHQGRQDDVARVMAAKAGTPASPAPADAVGGGPARPAQPGTMEDVTRAMLASQYPDIQAAGMQQMLAPPGAITQIKLGDRVVLMQDGKQIGEQMVGNSPDAVLREQGAAARHATPSGSAYLGANTTQRGQDMADARGWAGLEQARTLNSPEHQAALAGAKAGARNAAALQASAPKLAQKTALALESANSTIAEIDKAMANVGRSTAGMVGKALSKIPQTSAYELARTAETIRANVGFDRLQQMRDASPTGGALGQVAIQELVALQSSIASLDQGLSPARLRENLAKVREHYENWKQVVQQGVPQQADLNAPPNAIPNVTIDFNELP